jgi:RHS repeat-associated protein
MQAPQHNIAPPEYWQLQTTMDALGYDDTLSWAVQTSSGPDTNLAHYPRLMYYYHPDYLGHVEYITDLDGVPYQYFYYTAPMSRLRTSKPLAQRCFSADWSRPLARWGETLIEEKATRLGMHFESPYRFNAKELDEEPTNGSSRTPLKIKDNSEHTGNYYYGARYYNPMVSVWLSVDPKAYAFPHVTSYNFLLNNPIMMVDPGGDSTFQLRLDGSLKFLNANSYYKEKGGSVTEVLPGAQYNGEGVQMDKVISEKNSKNETFVPSGVLSRSDSNTGRSAFYFRDNSLRGDAENFYYWAADNSDVEWVLARGKIGGDFGGAVGTNFKSGNNTISSQFENQFGSRIDLLSHSHPINNTGPSFDIRIMGQNQFQGDLNVAAGKKTNYQREVYEVSTGKIYQYSEFTLGPARAAGGNYDYFYYKKP